MGEDGVWRDTGKKNCSSCIVKTLISLMADPTAGRASLAAADVGMRNDQGQLAALGGGGGGLTALPNFLPLTAILECLPQHQ